MRKGIIFICIQFIAAISYSQNRKSDSLHHLLSQRLTDTSRLGVFARLAEIYRGSKPDSGIFYGEKILNYPEKKEFAVFKAQASNSIGISQYMKAQYRDAIKAFQDYYKYSEKINDKK